MYGEVQVQLLGFSTILSRRSVETGSASGVAVEGESPVVSSREEAVLAWPQPGPPLSGETPGQRLARLRRERGLTQVELAEKTGLVQTLASDYERGKLRVNAGMILRFAAALDVSTDDLLQPASGPKPARKPSRRVLQRLERIEALPARVQTTVLMSLDLMLQSVSRKRRETMRRPPTNSTPTPCSTAFLPIK